MERSFYKNSSKTILFVLVLAGEPLKKSPQHFKSILASLLKEKTETESIFPAYISTIRYQTHQLRNVSDDYCATVQCYRYDDKDDIQWNQFDFVKVIKRQNLEFEKSLLEIQKKQKIVFIVLI